MKILFIPTTPEEIYNVMRQAVIGQDEPLKLVATALAAHLARCDYNQRNKKHKIQKDNLLILGPTGTGKTECIRTALRELKLPIPMAVVPTNTLSTAGYKGRQVEDILWDLAADARRLFKEQIDSYVFRADEYEMTEKPDGTKVKKVSGDAANDSIIELVQSGIIILDEIDKIRYSKANEYEAVYKKNMQHELLKIIEGTKGLSESAFIQEIDTTNILFICLGAFSELLNPPPKKADIGFSGSPSTKDTPDTDIPSTEELVNYGFAEELIGRLPLRCRFNSLSEADLYNILTNSSISPIKDFKALFESRSGNILTFTDESLHEIAKQAVAVNTGARGLRTIMGSFLYDIYFKTESSCRMDEIIIHADTVNGGEPEIRRVPFNELFKKRKSQPKAGK